MVVVSKLGQFDGSIDSLEVFLVCSVTHNHLGKARVSGATVSRIYCTWFISRNLGKGSLMPMHLGNGGTEMRTIGIMDFTINSSSLMLSNFPVS